MMHAWKTLTGAMVAVVTMSTACPALAQVTDEAKQVLKESEDALKKAQGLEFKSKAYATGNEMLAKLIDVEGQVKLLRSAGSEGEPMVLINGRMKDPGNPDRAINLATDGSVARWLDNKQNRLMERPFSDGAAREPKSSREMLVPDEMLKASYASLSTIGAVRKTGIDNVNGEVCDVIVAEPADKSRQTVWYISTADRLPRRREQKTESPEMKLAMVLDFTGVKASALTAKDFDLPLPTGFVRDVPVQAPVATPAAGLPSEAAVQLGLKAGAEAPDFKAVGVDGKEVSLGSMKGNVVVLEFWGSMFKKSMVPHTELQALATDFAGKKAQFVSLACRELDPEAAKKHWADSKLSYTLIPSGNEVAKAYNVVGYPTYFVIGADGKVASFFQDYPGKDELSKAISAAGAK